jgi:hypothetical protein
LALAVAGDDMHVNPRFLTGGDEAIALPPDTIVDPQVLQGASSAFADVLLIDATIYLMSQWLEPR